MAANLPIFIGIIVAFVGSGGIVFGALRYNREEAKAYIDIMRGLNTDMETSLELAHAERDALRSEVIGLRAECASLRAEIKRLTALLASRNTDQETRPS